MMMLLFPLIGDLPVSEHDKHTPGAAQAFVGPELKRLLGLPWPFQHLDCSE
jgi:hypothetical protein